MVRFHDGEQDAGGGSGTGGIFTRADKCRIAGDALPEPEEGLDVPHGEKSVY